MKIFIITLVFLQMGIYAKAQQVLTPQKYCESLAATSCEVLNIDQSNAFNSNSGVGSNLVIIKYCRDRHFKSAVFQLAAQGDRTDRSNTDHKLRFYNNAMGSYREINAVLSSSGLCAKTDFDGSSNYNIIP